MEHAIQTRSKGPVLTRRNQDSKSKKKAKAKPKPRQKPSLKGILKGSKNIPKGRRVLRHSLRYSLSAIDVSNNLAPSADTMTITCAATTTFPGDVLTTTSLSKTTTYTAEATTAAYASPSSHQTWTFEKGAIVQLPGDDPCPAGQVEVTFGIPRNLAWLEWPEQLTAIRTNFDDSDEEEE